MSRAKSDDTGYSSAGDVNGNWYSLTDLQLRDHGFVVPLDYKDHEASTKISIFARKVVAVGKEEQPMPYLLYQQGGLGFECPRPTETSGWILKACEEFRFILMDQRGTSLSTPLTPSSMQQINSAQNLADYLKHFRADSIVNDAAFIRLFLSIGLGPFWVRVMVFLWGYLSELCTTRIETSAFNRRDTSNRRWMYCRCCI